MASKHRENLIYALLPARRRRGRHFNLVVSVLDRVVCRELLRVQRLADGAAPRHDRSRIVPGRGRFAIPRLDPRVARRGTCAEIKFWTPHVIDATSSPRLRPLDGVEVHEGLRITQLTD